MAISNIGAGEFGKRSAVNPESISDEEEVMETFRSLNVQPFAGEKASTQAESTIVPHPRASESCAATLNAHQAGSATGDVSVEMAPCALKVAARHIDGTSLIRYGLGDLRVHDDCGGARAFHE
eukprot:2374962-Prymnesium_polylepis.1